MPDINGAGGTTFGGLSATGTGQVQWWDALQDDPADAFLTPATIQTVTFHVDTWDGGPVDVRLQVSTTDTFSSTIYDSVTLAVPEAPPTGVAISPLVDGVTYYWRVRPEPASGEVQPWSPTRSFTVFINASHAVEYVYENIGIEITPSPDTVEFVYENVGVEETLSPDAVEFIYENVGATLTSIADAIEYAYEGDVNTLTPEPRIWFLFPNFGREGDGIAIYGFGFGDLQTTYSGTVEIDWGGVTGWQTVPVVSWQTFPADANAYTEDRLLDPDIPHIDMQHQVIEIIVPSGAIPPGYPVRICTDGP